MKAVIHRSEVHNSTDLGIFAQGTGSAGTLDSSPGTSATLISGSGPVEDVGRWTSTTEHMKRFWCGLNRFIM